MLKKSEQELERERIVRDLRKEQMAAAFYQGVGTAAGLGFFSVVAGLVMKALQVF